VAVEERTPSALVCTLVTALFWRNLVWDVCYNAPLQLHVRYLPQTLEVLEDYFLILTRKTDVFMRQFPFSKVQSSIMEINRRLRGEDCLHYPSFVLFRMAYKCWCFVFTYVVKQNIRQLNVWCTNNQAVKICPGFQEPKYIVPKDDSIQSTQFHRISQRYILLLFSYLCLDLPRGICSWGIQTKPFTMKDFKFSRRRVWSSESSGMYCSALNWMSTDVSEVRAASYHQGSETPGLHSIKNTAVHPRRFWASFPMNVTCSAHRILLDLKKPLILGKYNSYETPRCVSFSFLRPNTLSSAHCSHIPVPST
jgi:hypothetical protein